MSDQSEDQKFTPVWIYPIPHPTTFLINFQAIFTGVTDGTTEQFKAITQQRGILQDSLNKDSYGVGLQAVSEYIPWVIGLSEAAEKQKPGFMKYLKIQWTTAISMRNNNVALSYPDFRFEVLMCLLAYGILLRNKAFEEMQQALRAPQGFEEASKSISKLLLQAAGIFEFIHSKELPRWTPRPDVPVPEFQPEVYEALQLLCLAEAQQFTVRMGMSKGMSLSLLAKVATNIGDNLETSRRKLKGLKNGMADMVLPPLLAYIQKSANMWRATTMKMLAMEYFNQKKIGECIACINKSKSCVDSTISDSKLNDFSKLSYSILRDGVNRLHESYNNENNHVYYESEKKEAATFPEGKALTQPTPYVPAEPKQVNIELKEGINCVVS